MALKKLLKKLKAFDCDELNESEVSHYFVTKRRIRLRVNRRRCNVRPQAKTYSVGMQRPRAVSLGK